MRNMFFISFLLIVLVSGCAKMFEPQADWEHIAYAHTSCNETADPAACLHNREAAEEIRGHHHRSSRR